MFSESSESGRRAPPTERLLQRVKHFCLGDTFRGGFNVRSRQSLSDSISNRLSLFIVPPSLLLGFFSFTGVVFIFSVLPENKLSR